MKPLCPNCKQPQDVVFQQPQIINGAGVSIIVIEHSLPAVCPGCLTRLLVQVMNIGGFGVGLHPLPPVEEKSLLHLPSSSLSN